MIDYQYKIRHIHLFRPLVVVESISVLLVFLPVIICEISGTSQSSVHKRNLPVFLIVNLSTRKNSRINGGLMWRMFFWCDFLRISVGAKNKIKYVKMTFLTTKYLMMLVILPLFKGISSFPFPDLLTFSFTSLPIC